jgi:hypothetical protein
MLPFPLVTKTSCKGNNKIRTAAARIAKIELIEAIAFRSVPPTCRPPWTYAEKELLQAVTTAHEQPQQAKGKRRRHSAKLHIGKQPSH